MTGKRYTVSLKDELKNLFVHAGQCSYLTIPTLQILAHTGFITYEDLTYTSRKIQALDSDVYTSFMARIGQMLNKARRT